MCPSAPMILAASLEDRVITVWQGLEEDTHNLTAKQEEITAIVDAWWKQWQQEAFPLFCPRKKWMVTHRNLKEGDVVLLKYQQQLTKDRFRLAKVTAVHPDRHGNVRTATVELRDLRRAKKEPHNKITTPTVPMVVAVQ